MIKTSKNQYGVTMLEIEVSNTRSQWVSLGKALAIIETGKTNGLIKEVTFKGRKLMEVTRLTGGKFKVGMNKINAVLDNIEEVLLLEVTC